MPPLISVSDVRDYLRIETNVEDAMLTREIAAAQGMAESYLGRPINARSIDVVAATRGGACPTQLVIPSFATPIDTTTTTPTIYDVNGDEVDETTYTIPDPSVGIVRAVPGRSFARGPYAVTVRAGLELLPEYEALIAPALASAILDIVADRYQRRNPAATSESGNGMSASYGASGLPPRVESVLNQWRAV